MASNPIPDGITELLTMADDAADGLHELETQGIDIGVKQNIETVIRADIDRVIVARRQYRAEQQAQDDRQDVQDEAGRVGRRFLVVYRKRVSQFLGDDYTPAWGEALGTTDSTAVASTISDRQDQLQSAAAYLGEHADYADAALGITAAKADEAYQALANARTAIHTGEMAVAAKQKALKDAVTALETRMRGLLGELGQLLKDDDETWYVFNLNRPADPATPDAAALPTLRPLGNGALEVIFTLPRRANYAHIWVKPDGSAEEPRRLDGQFQSPALLRDLPLNVPLLLFVDGVNEAGSGPRSAPAGATVS